MFYSNKLNMTIQTFILLVGIYSLVSGVHGFAGLNSKRIGVFGSRGVDAPSFNMDLPHTSKSITTLYSSREQAEQYLSENYPKFYWLLQQNESALQNIRDTKTGFAIFAPSDSVIDALGSEQIGMLESALANPELSQVVTRMAAYHMVSIPATTEVMQQYSVVTTRVGELPIEVAQDGTMYVNGVQIIQSYQFEDQIVQNYQDTDGNLLGSENVGGKTCIIHEVGGFVCPNELWQVIFEHYQSTGMGAM